MWQDRKDPDNKRVVPNGIDAGWAYNPGEAAWGGPQADQVMSAWRADEGAGWERLTSGDWQSEGRPVKFPLERAPAFTPTRAESRAQLRPVLEQILGGKERTYTFSGGKLRHEVHVSAESFARHFHQLDRARFLPVMQDVIERPYEVWLSFERHRKSGQVALRYRYIKGYQELGSGSKGMIVIVQAVRGQLEAWTAYPSRLAYFKGQRQGKLLFGR